MAKYKYIVSGAVNYINLNGGQENKAFTYEITANTAETAGNLAKTKARNECYGCGYTLLTAYVKKVKLDKGGS